MKAVERLSQRFGSHMDESMGGTSGNTLVHGGPVAPTAVVHGGPAEKYQGAARVKDALAIDLGRIIPDPDQPRTEFDPEALADLAASLKSRGQLQPIRVRWDDTAARWVVISGERRFRAAGLAGLPTLLCVEAKGPMTADDLLEDQLVENCVREDLRPIEQARAFKALIERRGFSRRQLAERLNVSHQAIVRGLALLDLPQDVQSRVEAGELAPSIAYEVARLDDPETQRDVAIRVASEGLTRDEVATEVRRAIRKPSLKGRGAKPAKCSVSEIARGLPKRILERL